MKKILMASGNQGKIREINLLMADLGLEVVGLKDIDLPAGFTVEEPAMTMEGNSVIKAMTYGQRSGLLTIAEDSGLEVDALDGRPGVFSARYCDGTDQDRNAKLLAELAVVPDAERGAQFRAVLAIFDPTTGKVRTCEGVYRGMIIRESRGENGFGYDPIFFNQDKKKTNAEMSVEEKNEVSHRGQTLRKAKEIIKQEFLD